MKSRHVNGCNSLLPVLILCLLLAMPAWSASTSSPVTRSADKVLVTDGHVSHTAGRLHNHVTNWGMIGSAPSVNTTFSHAPSGRWPFASGTDFLWAGGLWIGGVLNGETVVSTGAWSSEMYASEAPEDSIYPSYQGDAAGARFPWPNADDDGDGLEDEDPLNGRDDDNDGLVDEDFAAISHESYRCEYRDDTDLAQDYYPDHVPMGLRVTQESFVWDLPVIRNSIGYEFTITNVGLHTVDNMYVGMFSDFDVEEAIDDVAGYWEGLVMATDGQYYPVSVAYMRDDAVVNAVDGFQGWVLLGHTVDPAGVSAPDDVGVQAYRDWSGNAAYEMGGDPTNDAERYETLSLPIIDPPSLHGADHRIMLSSGPFTSLAPGQSLKYQVGLVSGINLDWLRNNAAELVACYQGQTYLRDGEPERVHWIPLNEQPVSASAGSMASRPVPGGLAIDIEANVSAEEGLALIRRAGAVLPERVWSGGELLLGGHFPNRIRYTVTDTDVGRGDRIYDLVQQKNGSRLTLDSLETGLPVLRAPELSASPNPFNPRLQVQYVTLNDGPVRLQAFDVRGHLVRTLLDETRSAGEGSLFWDGVDDHGQALASGVYQLKLETGGHLVEKRVTLVR